MFLSVLSVSFSINGGLVGKIPFEELHFNQIVLYIVREFEVSRRRGSAKHRIEH